MQQEQVYLGNSSITELETTVADIRMFQSQTAIALHENIFRPAGEGEPRDRGWVRAGSCKELFVHYVYKDDGRTWLVVDQGGRREIEVGATITAHINPKFRLSKSKLHTLMHLALGVTTRHYRNLRVEEADMDELAQTANITAFLPRPVRADDIVMIDRTLRTSVLASKPITIETIKSIDHAKDLYGELLRVSDRRDLPRNIRLIHIADLDVSPCSGCHYITSNVGPYSLKWMEERGQVLSIKLTLEPTWKYWFSD